MREEVKMLAEMLNGIQYDNINGSNHDQQYKDALAFAKKNNLIFVNGASDDLVEVKGAFEDEDDCYNGGKIYLTKNGIMFDSTESNINILWGNEVAFSYKTELPHCNFVVLESNGETDQRNKESLAMLDVSKIEPEDTKGLFGDKLSDAYCIGLVIDVNDLPEA